MYFLALFFPPLAVLLCKKPFQSMLNLLLTCLGWIPGVIHAILIVSEYSRQKQTVMVVNAVKGERQ